MDCLTAVRAGVGGLGGVGMVSGEDRAGRSPEVDPALTTLAGEATAETAFLSEAFLVATCFDGDDVVAFSPLIIAFPFC